MKSLWITLILIATCTVSNNSLSFAQTPDKLYQKGDERAVKKGDIVACQRLDTNLPTQKKEIPIARERLNRPTGKQPHLDRIGAALSRGSSRNNAFLGKVDASTDHLINGEPLIITGGPEPFLQSVLQVLKTAGKSFLAGGILTILLIFFLLILIIYLHVSYTDEREWKFIL